MDAAILQRQFHDDNDYDNVDCDDDYDVGGGYGRLLV